MNLEQELPSDHTDAAAAAADVVVFRVLDGLSEHLVMERAVPRSAPMRHIIEGRDDGAQLQLGPVEATAPALLYVLDEPVSTYFGGEAGRASVRLHRVAGKHALLPMNLLLAVEQEQNDVVARERLLVVHSEDCQMHGTVGLNEQPLRYTRIMQMYSHLQSVEALAPFITVDHCRGARADSDLVHLVHSVSYTTALERQIATAPLEKTGEQGTLLLRASGFEGGSNGGDTFATRGSWEAALSAAGVAVEAVDRVLSGLAHRVIAVIRPPGHHAGRAGATGEGDSRCCSQGFCLLNNVSIAARFATDKRGLSRVAIVDFDLHAGNGTAELIAGDDRFRMFDFHVGDGEFYPGTGMQSVEGNVRNFIVSPDASSKEKRALFQAGVEEMERQLKEWRPQLILVSAGFDAHENDTLCFGVGGLKDSEYNLMAATLLSCAGQLKECKGVVSCLEGGYAVENGALTGAMEVYSLCHLVRSTSMKEMLTLRTPSHVNLKSCAKRLCSQRRARAGALFPPLDAVEDLADMMDKTFI